MKFIKFSMPNGEKRFKAIIFGVIIGAALCALLLAIFSVLFSKAGFLPTEYLWIFVTAILALSGFAGGYVSSAIYKSKGLLTGLITGAVLFLAVAAGTFLNESSDPNELLLYKALALIVCGAIGGIIGVNKKEKIKIK